MMTLAEVDAWKKRMKKLDSILARHRHPSFGSSIETRTRVQCRAQHRARVPIVLIGKAPCLRKKKKSKSPKLQRTPGHFTRIHRHKDEVKDELHTMD